MKKPLLASLVIALLAALAVTAARAQVKVDDAWVRPTVAQQKVTGAFMQITAPKGGKLVAASSPLAELVEVHEMHMEGDTMRMRAVPALALPAGQPVSLKPGSYHVMLMGLKSVVNAGDVVPLTLVVEGADGKRESVEVKAVARAPR